jgi:uncharacterized membrane protein
MTLLVFGVVLFFSTHLLRAMPLVHTTLLARLGEGRFRGMYIAISVVGMIGLIIGKAMAGFVEVWQPPAWTNRIVMLPMLLACVLFSAVALPTNIRRFTRHPMLWGIALWSASHCLTNGDLASIILFGSFGLYSLFEMWSLNARGALKSDVAIPYTRDIALIVTGLVVYIGIIGLHPLLFGVRLLA